MKTYCLIKDGIIIEGPAELPQAFRNVSNFNCLSDVEVKAYGWLPLIEENTPGEILVSSEITVLEDHVKRVAVYRAALADELVASPVAGFPVFQENSGWSTFRSKRNDLLAMTDRFMLLDNWNKLSSEDQEKLIAYRQQLRDLPSVVEDPTNFNIPAFPL